MITKTDVPICGTHPGAAGKSKGHESGGSMREILFRGKAILEGIWVEGDLNQFSDGCKCIVDSEMDCFRVIPETVGQHTGLTDKNGKKIFEGDILQIIGYGEVIDRCVIGYGIYDSYGGTKGSVGFYLYWKTDKKQSRKYSNPAFWVNVREAVCIGNIHDNPELLA